MKDLFGAEIIIPSIKHKGRLAISQYRQLLSFYGKRENKTCRDCHFLKRHQGGSKVFSKCHKASISHGRATDWNMYWIACGLFKERE